MKQADINNFSIVRTETLSRCQQYSSFSFLKAILDSIVLTFLRKYAYLFGKWFKYIRRFLLFRNCLLIFPKYEIKINIEELGSHSASHFYTMRELNFLIVLTIFVLQEKY